MFYYFQSLATRTTNSCYTLISQVHDQWHCLEFLIEVKYIPISNIQDYSLTESVYYCHQENYVFMNVYNKHVKLTLRVSHFYCNITITINPTIKSILIITELIYLNSLQFNKHLHKVTYILLNWQEWKESNFH